MAKNEAHKCVCSPTCEATTKRVFAPGHDARMVGRLKREAEQGKITAAQARKAVTDVGGSELLAIKAENSAAIAIQHAENKTKAAKEGMKAAQAVKSGRTEQPATKRPTGKIPAGAQRGATSASRRKPQLTSTK